MMRRVAFVVAGLLLALCCAAAATGALLYVYQRGAVSRPVVLISSPRQDEDVRVGEAVVVQASARDEDGVVRVELWLDGGLLEAQRSTLPEGTSPFPLVTSWQPSSPGTHTLAVRAFNGEDGRAYASISVEALEVPDRDGDGVADEDDSCPDEPGFGTSAGCPDGDGDGIPDADDACPEEVGIAEADGCPAATEGDRDGDGVVDTEDACPDDVGLPQHDGCPRPADLDGDGVDDELDECPGEPGLSELGGCPDLDGDGVGDGDDDCPAQPGLPQQGGCPDRDGDGVRDPDDLRPDEPGRPENYGAPDTGAPDSDGDGLADDLDRCDDEEGPSELDGCRPPGHGADLNDDGIADEDQASEGNLFGTLGGGLLGIFVGSGLGAEQSDLAVVEVEALEFQVFDRYDEVYCYVGLAGEGMERYGPFEPVGETHWDIAALLGGENSRRIMLPEVEALEVRIECGAYGGVSREVTEPEEGFGEIEEQAVPFDLGSFAQQHPREQWDGQPIMVPRSEGGTDGRFFRATYRICVDSCAETALPPPHLWSHQMFAGQRYLEWTWTGDLSSMDGFHARYDCYDRSSGDWWRGATISIPAGQSSLSIEAYEPDYGHSCEWSVWAYRESDGVESPHSNIVIVDLPRPRGRAVSLTFDTFRADDAPGRGPIRGNFWANEQVLSFDGADPSWCGFYDTECGYYLPPANEAGYTFEIHVAALFAEILRLHLDCPDCSYDSPSTNHLTVSLPEGEDLTIGFNLWEYHKEGADTLLCRESCTIDYDDLRDDNYYYCPSEDFVVSPCRVHPIVHVGDWPGGG